MVAVSGHAGVDQWLFTWHRNGNVHRDTQPLVYWHAICSGHRVSLSDENEPVPMREKNFCTYVSCVHAESSLSVSPVTIDVQSPFKQWVHLMLRYCISLSPSLYDGHFLLDCWNIALLIKSLSPSSSIIYTFYV